MDPIRSSGPLPRTPNEGGASRLFPLGADGFETELRSLLVRGVDRRDPGAASPVAAADTNSTAPSRQVPPATLPLTASRRAEARETQRTELELRAAFLREMLAPLVESLSSGLSGNASSAGQDVYEYFVSEALSRPLAEGWPLPPIAALAQGGTQGATATTLGLTLGRLPGSAASAGVPVTEGAGLTSQAAIGLPHGGTRGGALEGGNTNAAIADRAALGDGTASRGGATIEPSAEGPIRRGAARTRIDDLVAGAAREFALPESLLQAMVQVESSGNPRAVSPKGAQGLLQLMPGTAREVGVEDPFDAEQNLRGGAAYLARQLERFGDLPRALAAYNAGPGAVAKHGGIPPYPETRAYVERVLGLAQELEE